MSTYPLRRPALPGEINPSIHWAQEHTRYCGERYTRRIYDFELLYIIEGTLELEIGGRSLQARAGELVYLQAGVPHSFLVTSDPFAVMLGIHYDYFDELYIQQDNDIIVDERNLRVEQFCAEPMLKAQTPMIAEVLSVPSPELIPLMRTVIKAFTERRDAFELTCRGAMLQIFALLARHEPGRRSVEPKYLEELLTIAGRIQDDPRHNWTNDTVAEALRLEVSYAAKLFKQVHGMTPNKYIQYIRHQQAKTFLRETDMKISAISLAVGYDDFHYFSRSFKKLEGLSPLQYRKMSQIF